MRCPPCFNDFYDVLSAFGLPGCFPPILNSSPLSEFL